MAIPLPQGQYALVDEADYELVAQYIWSAQKTKYSYYVRCRVGGRANRTVIYLHRLIMAPPDHLVVDHINGNGLDNRRANLRIVTPAENARNRVHGGKPAPLDNRS